MTELKALGGSTVVQAAADVAAQRERSRRARVRKLIMVGCLVVLWWCGRELAGNPVHFGPPRLSAGMLPLLPPLIIVVGRVLDLEVSREAKPLLFYRGGFGRFEA